MDLKDARIVINVSGTRFETNYSVLERFPGSRLALLAILREDDEAFDRERREYYFDRHPEAFADILHFYRTEELHIRRNLCGNVIKREFEFWGMFEQDIEPCCWTSYSQASECKDTLAAIDSTFLTGSFAVQADVWKSETNKWIRFRRRMWSILEDPVASLSARIYVFVSMFMVVTSIVCFVSETYEAFRVPIDGANMTVSPTCTTACGVYVDPQAMSGARYYDDDDTEPHPILRYLDYSLFVFFTLELSLRIFFTPDYKVYFTDFLNWIDITCVVTHAVSLIIGSIETMPNYTPTLVKTVLTLRVLRGLRIVRVLRIFKLVKHYNAFRILVYTIKISLRELLLMIVFLFVGAVIFGSVIHLVEKDSFRNIPYGLWWALVTMTTVGYGDFAPRQAAGYAIGCICVIFGVLTIAFTVPIVVNNFAMYYSHAQSRNKKPREYWRIKRVPQKFESAAAGDTSAIIDATLTARTTVEADITVLDCELEKEALEASPPTEAQLYGADLADGEIGWNNFNFNDDGVGSTDLNNVETPTGSGRGSTGGAANPRIVSATAEASRQKALLKREEDEERSRQMLAQAQESAEQLDKAREVQAAAIEKRKEALRQRQRANLARLNHSRGPPEGLEEDDL